jgi:hypothetical protein
MSFPGARISFCRQRAQKLSCKAWLATRVRRSVILCRCYSRGVLCDLYLFWCLIWRYQVPPMGESITEGTVVTFLKNVGDYVEIDEPVLQIETDKVVSTPFERMSWPLARNVLFRHKSTVARRSLSTCHLHKLARSQGFLPRRMTTWRCPSSRGSSLACRYDWWIGRWDNLSSP